MNDLLIIAFGSGLQDGLNPCIFMTCAIFIAHGLWLSPNFSRMGLLRSAFVLVYAFGILFFNFGPGQLLVYQKNFIFTAKILYFLLGIIAFILGILFFKDWVLIRRGSPLKDLIDGRIKPFAGRNSFAYVMTVMLAVVLSALSTMAPVNSYIVLLGSAAIVKGQWQMVMPMLADYILFIMWPLWFIWAFLSIRNLRPSLLKIICAAVFFTASSCVILIFK